MVRVVLALFVTLLGCASTADTNNTPRTCKKDSDCGDRQYCTIANVCRTDCYKDSDCFGPYPDSQCNSHGRCIDPVDAAPPPPEDAKPPLDAEIDTESEGGK